MTRKLIIYCWLGLFLQTMLQSAWAQPSQVNDAVAQCRAVRLKDARAALQLCQQAYLTVQNNPLLAFEMLSHRSDAEVATGDLAKAGQTLTQMAQIVLPAGHWEYQYRLLKRRGMLAYRKNQLSDAQALLQQALVLAKQHQHNEFLGFIYTDLGTVARRSGDYKTALQSLQLALEYQRQVPHSDLAPTLNNLGDLHKDLGEYDDARNRYTEARTLFSAQGKTQKVAHATESLGLVAEAAGDIAKARQLLGEAHQSFMTLGAKSDVLRVLGDELRLALNQGDLEQAAVLQASWQEDSDTNVPLRLWIQSARFNRLQGNSQKLLPKLLALVDSVTADDRYQSALLFEIAESYSALGDLKNATLFWRKASEADRALLARNYQLETSALRVGLDVQQNQRVKAEAEASTARAEAALQRTRIREYWIVASALFALLIATVLVLWERARRKRQRVENELRLAQAQAQYRLASELLTERAERYEAILQRFPMAAAVIYADSTIERCNQAFADLLQSSVDALQRQQLLALCPSIDLANWQQTLGQIDEAEQAMLLPWQLSLPDLPQPLMMQISGVGAGQISFLITATLAEHASMILSMDRTVETADDQADQLATQQVSQNHQNNAADALETARQSATAPPTADPPPNDDALDGDSESSNDSGQSTGNSAGKNTGANWKTPEIRQRLVSLMIDSLNAFERCTGKTRIDLAERSKLWRVTVDDGRLRVRAMERYLSVSKLPKQPRWREVLRTAYFVLSECALDAEQRVALEQQARQLQNELQQEALVDLA